MSESELRRPFPATKWFWLSVGLLGGVMISHFWPSEPAAAAAFQPGLGKMTIFSCNTQNLGGQPDAVFILDFVSGRLMGAALHQQSGKFTQFYGRNLPADFGLTGASAADAEYYVTTGQLNISSRSSNPPPAQGGIYVAEMKSGKCILYGFPYQTAGATRTMIDLVPIDGFPFRESL